MRHAWTLLALLAALVTFSTAMPAPTDDVMAWVDPDGFLIVHVERDGGLLYFDSFNVSELYAVTQSGNMEWANRWEFLRE